ncbi:MAG: sulfite exporter TauE/SafE family protein [Mobilicoccus sp.]|nr:sulfite exporter TauE/SafE family protein [Mobilicoccus sp.]
MAHLGVDALGWAVLAMGAFLVGVGKTAIGGVVTISVVLFATILPTRESTGVLLVLLLIGDAIAVWTYRRDAHMRLLLRLVAPVLVGVVVGALFLAQAPDGWIASAIGSIVVAMASIEIGQRLVRQPRGQDAPTMTLSRTAGRGFGSLAGFTTMVANAGGPVMSLYLLRENLGVRGFVGTFAWFFAAVNLMKLPFSLGIGLVRPERLPLLLTLAPCVVLGAVVGRLIIGRIRRDVFEWLILLTALISGGVLMVR